MHSCIKCWDNPCECGWEYREGSKQQREKIAAAVLGIKLEFLYNHHL